MTRYIDQVVRAFSGFQYVSYPGGVETYNVVPCLPAITNALVANLISNGSTATLPSFPFISVNHVGLEDRRNDLQSTTHVSTITLTERKIVDGAYTSDQGVSYRVDRLMPRPFKMLFELDIYVSNQDQKYQILEQLLCMVYPSFQIQNSENPIDWSAQTQVIYTGLSWTKNSAQAAVNTSETYDTASITFEVPIWLNPPARVEPRKRIEAIVTNWHDGSATKETVIQEIFTNTQSRQDVTTLGDHQIAVNNNKITLLNGDGGLYDENLQILDWAMLIRKYGSLYPGVSNITLTYGPSLQEPIFSIVGTLDYDQTCLNILDFTLNTQTLPADTTTPVSFVINPMKNWPGDGTLPNGVIGQRYLICQPIDGPNLLWGTIVAKTNDIIEFNGSSWYVAFHPTPGTPGGFVTNQATGRQLRWDGDDWVFTYDGVYRAGYWRLNF